ncbi:hypothetical protein NC653_029761 [Populus alba x Populus x berolinensis]|uniref:Uncharacterized protein n=2 Tax=Populus TaxID=3689 RepID=A0A4U5MYK1_POPAL|nr:hypothetical protein NC653_029761 [Populus alba x Populus x berolinensis]TKR74988.1 hypothetical protein D5086_0000289800 [Populus alba]
MQPNLSRFTLFLLFLIAGGSFACNIGGTSNRVVVGDRKFAFHEMSTVSNGQTGPPLGASGRSPNRFGKGFGYGSGSGSGLGSGYSYKTGSGGAQGGGYGAEVGLVILLVVAAVEDRVAMEHNHHLTPTENQPWVRESAWSPCVKMLS